MTPVHLTFSEKVACGTISPCTGPHLYTLSFVYLYLPSKRPHIDFHTTSFKTNVKPYPLLSSFNDLYKECSSALHPVFIETVARGTIFPCIVPHLYTVFMYLYLPSKRPPIDFHTTSFKTNNKPYPLLPSSNDSYSECRSALQ